MYDACTESFCALPVAGLLDGKFFCVHGGISPELNMVSDIDRVRVNSTYLIIYPDLSYQVNRFMEPASAGLLCDLLWSDPVPNFGYESEPSPHSSLIPPGQIWGHNTTRGCSFYFTYVVIFFGSSFLMTMYSYEAVIKFLQRNDLLGVIRGHEAQDAGYV